MNGNGLGAWLQYLRLEKYLPQLSAMGHDARSLALLDDAQLAALGLPLGPRKKIRLNAGLMLQSCGVPVATSPGNDPSPGPVPHGPGGQASNDRGPREPGAVASLQPTTPAPVPDGQHQLGQGRQAGAGLQTASAPSARPAPHQGAPAPAMPLRPHAPQPPSAWPAAPTNPDLSKRPSQRQPAWQSAARPGSAPPAPPPPLQQPQPHQPHHHAPSGGPGSCPQQAYTSAGGRQPQPQHPACQPSISCQPPMQPPQPQPPTSCQPAMQPPQPQLPTSCQPPMQPQQPAPSSAATRLNNRGGSEESVATTATAAGVARLAPPHTAASGLCRGPGPPGPPPAGPPPGHASCTGGTARAWQRRPQVDERRRTVPIVPDGGGATASPPPPPEPGGGSGSAAGNNGTHRRFASLSDAERDALARLYPAHRPPASATSRHSDGAQQAAAVTAPASDAASGAGGAVTGAAGAWALGGSRGRVLKRSRSWDGTAWLESGDGGCGVGRQQRRLGEHSGGGGSSYRGRWRDGQTLFTAAASSQPVDCSLFTLMGNAASTAVPEASSEPGGIANAGGAGGRSTASGPVGDEPRKGSLPAATVPTTTSAPQPQPQPQPQVPKGRSGPPDAPSSASLLDDPRNYETPELLAELLYDDGDGDDAAAMAAAAVGEGTAPHDDTDAAASEQATQPRRAARECHGEPQQRAMPKPKPPGPQGSGDCGAAALSAGSGPLHNGAAGIAPGMGGDARGAGSSAYEPRGVGAARGGDAGADARDGLTREQRLARLQALREEVAATERLLDTLRRMVAEEEEALAAGGGGGRLAAAGACRQAAPPPPQAAVSTVPVRGGHAALTARPQQAHTREHPSAALQPQSTCLAPHNTVAVAAGRMESGRARTTAPPGGANGGGRRDAEGPVWLGGQEGEESEDEGRCIVTEEARPGWTLEERFELLA